MYIVSSINSNALNHKIPNYIIVVKMPLQMVMRLWSIVEPIYLMSIHIIIYVSFILLKCKSTYFCYLLKTNDDSYLPHTIKFITRDGKYYIQNLWKRLGKKKWKIGNKDLNVSCSKGYCSFRERIDAKS